MPLKTYFDEKSYDNLAEWECTTERKSQFGRRKWNKRQEKRENKFLFFNFKCNENSN